MNEQEQTITEQIAKVYGFIKNDGKQGGFKCSKCGTRLTKHYSSGGVNERMIQHNCKTSILGRGGVGSSRN